MGERRVTSRLTAGVAGIVMTLLATLTPVRPAAAEPAVSRSAMGAAAALAQQVDPGPEPGPALYDEGVMTDDPLLYWRLDDTGATATDASGNGYTGTLRSDIVVGEPGPLVDDDDDAVSIPTTGAAAVTASATGLPDGDDPRTIEAWARTGEAVRNIVNVGDFLIETRASTLHVRLDIDSWFEVPLLVPLTTTGWHHYALTLDDTGLVAVYMDGQAIGTHTDTAVTTSLAWDVGVGSGAGSYDEVAVYDSALSAERIRDHWFRATTRVHTDPCPEGEEASAPTDAHGLAVLEHAPLVYLRPGDAPQTDGERLAYDWSGHCRHGAISQGGVITSPATVGSTGGIDRPSPSAETWAVAADGSWMPTAAGPLSVEVWAKGTLAGWRSVAQLGTGFHVALVDAKRGYIESPGVLGQYFDLPYSAIDDTWHQFVVSSTGSSVAVYFDGRVVWGGTPPSTCRSEPCGQATPERWPTSPSTHRR